MALRGRRERVCRVDPSEGGTVSDDEIERLRRAVAGGDLTQRRALLQALLRADRPLAEAFPGDDVKVRIEPDMRTEQVLDVVARVDPARIHATRSKGRATLLDLGAKELRIVVDEGEVVLYSDDWEEYDRGMASWAGEGWRWRADAPAHVERIAASPTGDWAALERLGLRLEAGPPEALERGEPVWKVRAEPLVALGVTAERVLIVTKTALVARDRGTGEPVGDARPLPLKAKVATVDPAAGRIVVADGKGVAVLDLDGEVVWHHPEARRTGKRARRDAARITGVALGAGRVAVCAAHVFLWDAETGESRGRAARGTQTSYWEDSQSTMGLGRDSGVSTFDRPDLVAAVFSGDELLTLDRSGDVFRWRIYPKRGARRRTRKPLGKAKPPLLAVTSDGLAVCPDGAFLRLIGEAERVVDLGARPRAFAPCGGDLLVGCDDGSVRRVEVE